MGAICLLVLLAVNAVLGKSALRYNPEDASDHFETFISTYEKEYDETEKAHRFEIFMKNLEIINYLNSRSKTAVFGITQFSDLTSEEFIQQYTGYRSSNHTANKTKVISKEPKINLKFEDTPESFDWREKGVVSDVKDQLHCGSCWAFSTIATVESAYAIKTNQSVLLSEQQLVDCVTDHCEGCRGGLPNYACEYLKLNGVMSADSYPYEGRDDQCKYNSKNIKVQVKNCLELSVSEDELANKLATIGPLSIAIDSHVLRHYHGGIIADDFCSGSKLNHAVLLVGYGTDGNGNKYWVVKNSWGVGFGEQGYFKMQRGVNCLSVMNTPPLAIAIVSYAFRYNSTDDLIIVKYCIDVVRGNLESAYAIKHQQSVSLSEQQLVDCDQMSAGCNGGNVGFACEYLRQYGSMTEDRYPFEERDNVCRYNSRDIRVKVKSCKAIQVTEDELAYQLFSIGPLMIGVNSEKLQPYRGGLLTDCQAGAVNHAILLVGYGTDENGNKYWLAKNSWGTVFGEHGYLRMLRGVNCLNLMADPAVTAVVD
ncbi:thiol protease aleurain-like [Vanessa atalanta]|uniref:thiol protease aleurain-like n=1 Tax=Vanessa atalanta TaxID=42275 RepID=UPI001FCE0A9F|nr:thiol protease aleurain-like [Vanessa atalanta]